MIVFYLPDLRAGGAERVMLNLLTYFAKQGMSDVALLLGKKEGNLLCQVPDNISVFSLNSSSAKSSVIPLVKFCRNYKPDLIFGTLGASLALALAKPFIPSKTKVINRLGNTIGAEKLLYTNLLKRKFYLLANYIIAKMSSKLIFQCDYMAKDFLRETGVCNLNYKVIYNPVDIQRIEQMSQESIDRKYDFVAVGRLDIQKDYFTLLEAANILKKRKCNFTIAILGDGILHEKIEIKIAEYGLKNNVFILGYVQNPYPYIRNAKFLLSSSLYEGFSNVIIEALCLGTPVIASDCPGGNKETINIDNGMLFPVQDLEQMANTIEKGLIDSSSFDSIGIAKLACEKYGIDIIAKQYIEVLQK